MIRSRRVIWGGRERLVYGKLISNGYKGAVISSGDGNDWDSVNYLRGLIYKPGEDRIEAEPLCLKPPKISASCKYVGSADLSTVADQWVAKEATPIYVYEKIGGMCRFPGERAGCVHKPNAYRREKISPQGRDCSM